MKVTASQLAALLGGKVIGNPEVFVERLARIEGARNGDLSFVANAKYARYLATTQASVVLVGRSDGQHAPEGTTLIEVDNVYEAMSQLTQYFERLTAKALPETKGYAVVQDGAQVAESAYLADFVVVCSGAVIAAEAVLHAHVYVGPDCHVGKGTVLHPGVVLYRGCQVGERVTIHANSVIGSDGFGFVKTALGYEKMSQLGNVIIEDDVEIGSNVVVDRASLGSTIIRQGAKLDNLIQVAHNVEIGRHSVLAAQAGIAGSTKVGDGVQIGGQAGIVGHIEIGNGTSVQAQSGVISSVADGSKLYGSPAIDYTDYLRSYAAFRKLPAMMKEMANLKKRIEDLEQLLNTQPTAGGTRTTDERL